MSEPQQHPHPQQQQQQPQARPEGMTSFVRFPSSAFSVPSRGSSVGTEPLSSRAAAFSATSRAVSSPPLPPQLQHLGPSPPPSSSSSMPGQIAMMPVPFLGAMPARSASNAVAKPHTIEDPHPPPVVVKTKEVTDGSCTFVQAPFPEGITMGSLVFAKVKGHAWWPGRISGVGIASSSILHSMHGTGLLVFFFGEHNYSLVSSDAIAPFDAFMAKAPPRKRRSKILRAAIREAEAVHNGELVIDESAFLAVGSAAEDEAAADKAKTSRSKKRTVEKETFEQQRRSFRRRVMRRIALFPPEALMDDYPQLASFT